MQNTGLYYLVLACWFFIIGTANFVTILYYIFCRAGEVLVPNSGVPNANATADVSSIPFLSDDPSVQQKYPLCNDINAAQVNQHIRDDLITINGQLESARAVNAAAVKACAKAELRLQRFQKMARLESVPLSVTSSRIVSTDSVAMNKQESRETIRMVLRRRQSMIRIQRAILSNAITDYHDCSSLRSVDCDCDDEISEISEFSESTMAELAESVGGGVKPDVDDDNMSLHSIEYDTESSIVRKCTDKRAAILESKEAKKIRDLRVVPERKPPVVSHLVSRKQQGPKFNYSSRGVHPVISAQALVPRPIIVQVGDDWQNSLPRIRQRIGVGDGDAATLLDPFTAVSTDSRIIQFDPIPNIAAMRPTAP